MIQDLHSHTRYSNCGRDEPSRVVETAAWSGIDLLGVTDHNYGIGPRGNEYKSEIEALARAFSGRIRVLCGIEIATHAALFPGWGADLTPYAYCLVEHIDDDDTRVGAGIADYARDTRIATGIAHTDLFAFMKRLGKDPRRFLAELSKAGVFWEMNVNFDSIHHYKEHAYVKAFMESEEQQALVREAGLKLSVGFDGHRAEDYLPDRVASMNAFLEKRKIARVFEDI